MTHDSSAAAGLPDDPHREPVAVLHRHAFAPLNLHAGGSLRDVQTGHGTRSPRTTRIARARSACHGEHLAWH
jgi:hypothetical protein